MTISTSQGQVKVKVKEKGKGIASDYRGLDHQHTSNDIRQSLDNPNLAHIC